MIAIFGDQYMSDKARARLATGNGKARHICPKLCVTALADKAGLNMANDAERGGDIIEHFDNARSGFEKVLAAAGRAGTLLKLMHNLLAW